MKRIKHCAQLLVILSVFALTACRASESQKVSETEGLPEAEIDRLLVLDIREREYFSSRGIDNEHGGGGLFAQDEDIMGWLFSQKKINQVLSDAGTMYTTETKITDVINDPVFGDYGRLIFPVESGYYGGDTLGSLRLTWYNNIDPDTTVEIVNYMRTEAAQGNKIFYDIYTDEEKKADPDKEDTGLNDYSEVDPPTFVTVGENDMIADWRVMKQRLDAMSRIGIPTEFHSYPGLGHGFGIGKGTVAEGWLDEAVEFWEGQSGLVQAKKFY